MAAKKQIDLALVLDTAAEVANVGGIEAVTLAAVAERLGIRIPSLYHYVDGLAGLRYRLTVRAAHAFNERLRRALMGVTGDDAVRAVTQAARAFALEHPGVYAATQTAAASEQTDLLLAQNETLELMLVVLAPYGLDVDDNLHAIRIFRAALHGFVDLEVRGGFGLALDRETSFNQLVDLLILGLRTPRAVPSRGSQI